MRLCVDIYKQDTLALVVLNIVIINKITKEKLINYTKLQQRIDKANRIDYA